MGDARGRHGPVDGRRQNSSLPSRLRGGRSASRSISPQRNAFIDNVGGDRVHRLAAGDGTGRTGDAPPPSRRTNSPQSSRNDVAYRARSSGYGRGFNEQQWRHASHTNDGRGTHRRSRSRSRSHHHSTGDERRRRSRSRSHERSHRRDEVTRDRRPYAPTTLHTSADARRIAADIMRAPNIHALMSFISHVYTGDLNGFHDANVASKCVKLYKATRVGSDTATARALFVERASIWLDRSRDEEGTGARQAVTLLHAAATLDAGNDALRRDLVTAAADRAATFNPQEAANSLWAVGKLRTAVDADVMRLVSAAARSARTFSTGEAVMALIAAAALDLRDRDAVQELAEAAARRSPSFTAMESVNALAAASKLLGLIDTAVVNTLAASASKLAHSFNTQDAERYAIATARIAAAERTA